MQPYPFPPPKVLAPLPRLPAPPRTLIRDHVAALLIYRTDAGQSVYRSKVHPMPEDIPAALVVWTMAETRKQQPNSPTLYDCSLTLAVELKVIAAEGHHQGRTDGADEEENWDSVLDRLCTQVETALFLDPWLNRVATITDVNTRMGFAAEGAFVPGSAMIEFRLEYPMEALAETADGTLVLGMRVDVIDPAADPNRLRRFDPPRATGPDGRPEIDAGIIHRATS